MTYDEKQIGAVLVRCAACGLASYMTQPQSVCIACRRLA